jgi:hypothetical protein
MSLQRNRSWLLAGVLVLLAGGAVFGQGLRDAQPFAPADEDQFGGGPRAKQGFFIVYDGLFWTISAPREATFGVPSAEQTARPVFWGPGAEASTTQQSTLTSGFLKTDWTGGQRVEFGNIHEHEGWKISYLDLARSTQVVTQDAVQVFFEDRPWGAPPNHLHLEGFTANDALGNPDPASIRELGVEYTAVTLRNRIKTWGLEASYLLRTHPMPGGGFFEWSLGARYIELREDFSAEAFGGILADTLLWSEADNRMVGPQIGLRWFRSNDRWTLSVQGDFTAAVNMQSMRMQGIVGSLLSTDTIPRPVTSPPLPLAMQPSDFSHMAHMQEFSPIVEVRVAAEYQITSAVSIHGGWSALWIDHVARPSGMIDYTLGETTTLGILTNKNRQNIFMNGLELGVAVNY